MLTIKKLTNITPALGAAAVGCAWCDFVGKLGDMKIVWYGSHPSPYIFCQSCCDDLESEESEDSGNEE